MNLKLPESEDAIIWFIMGFFATWGGVVRLVLKDEEIKNKPNIIKALLIQVFVSGFTGFLGGLVTFEYGGGHYLAIAISGVFGSLGDTGLLYIQSHIIKIKTKKN